MEKIKKINLEIGLFVKQLNAYIENVNEINDETIRLLINTNESVSKLRKNAQFCEITSNESGFVNNLNNDVFECRPYIVCRLCFDHFPLSTQYFALHCQKADHKVRESAQRHHSPSGCENHLMRTKSLISINDTRKVNDDQRLQPKTASPHNNLTQDANSPISTQKLLNAMDVKKVSDAIPAISVDLVYHMGQRCFIELKIQAQLTRYLKEFDSSLEVMPFGSATYGFGGSHTNFDNAEGAMQKPFETFQSIEMLFKAHDLQTDFKVLSSIKGDRVRKTRLEVVHNTSGILCSIQVSSSSELAESSQIIRNCIMHSPICYHLIAYVRAWQIAVNETAAQNGCPYAFRMNTYIISVLVVFFLQVKHNFPKLSDVPQSQAKFIDFVPKVDEDDRKKLKKAAKQFFEFYGRVYEKCKLISLDMGRWQNRRLDKKQSELTPERQKLQISIKSSPQNWENCTMFVQDVKSPGVNITAELSEKEVENFRALCKMFISSTLHEQLTDKYLLELSQMQCTSFASSLESNVHSVYEPPSHSLHEVKNDMAKKGHICDAAKSTDGRSNDVVADGNVGNISAPSKPTSVTKLENAIKIDEVLTLARIGMGEIQSRSAARIDSEQEIIEKFSFLLTTFDPEITVVPFGSVTFGFGGPKTDFNILITEGTSLASHELQILIQDLLKTTGLQQDFELLSHIQENRVHCEQLKVLHKDSNIVCVLNFNTRSVLLKLEQATKIIRDYMSLHPMCKRLIAYVKAWQNVLNEESFKSGSEALNMNSYIIAVLVIFYLQLNHGVPIVAELPLAIANGSKFSTRKSFDEFVKDFFKFYGQKLEPKMHLISAHVGKWQQKSQKEQKVLTQAQKSLRDGIATNSKDWENSTMCVQDLILPHINITAELTKQKVDNFVRMCQIFAKQLPNCDDECSMTIPNTTCTMGLPLQSLNQGLDFIGLIKKEISSSHVATVLERRKKFELEITSKLATYIRKFNPTLKLFPFGSTQYGVKIANANFNLLISTNGEKSKEMSKRFVHKLQQTDILRHFEKIYKKSADRVLKRQINMVHIESGIQCFILFQKTSRIVESTEIVKRFAANSLCHDLITFVRIWQDILNQRGIARIEFNTYIISVLAMFFLQMNYGYPTVDQLMNQNSTICSKTFNMKLVLRNFFAFYGNRYDMLNHVISANIGQWQDRRSLSEQNSSTLARLRSAMNTTPENWEDCPMFVQDLVRSNINITAEISKSTAENFQKMCKQFATELS